MDSKSKDVLTKFFLFMDLFERYKQDHPERPNFLRDFLAAIGDTNLGGDHGDLTVDGRLLLLREMLALCPESHPLRSWFQQAISDVLTARYIVGGSAGDLNESIVLNKEALALHPSGHPDRGSFLSSLANTLIYRYRHAGSESDLDEAIRLYREALAFYPRGHPDRGTSLNNLAGALNNLYQCRGSENDLNETIKLYKKALALHPPGHSCRGMTLNNLSTALGDRYRRTGSRSDLEECVSLDRDALRLCTPQHVARGSFLNNLAESLHSRYQLSGSEDDLNESIELHREALALRPRGHPKRGISLSSLSSTLLDRYERTGSEDVLSETIELQREALALHPPGYPGHSMTLNNLSDALGFRYRRTGSRPDLEETISLNREALALCTSGHVDRGIFLNNLGIAVKDRYQISGLEDDLNESIELHREALALRPLGHPHRSVSLNNLASALNHAVQCKLDVTSNETKRLLIEASAVSVSSISLEDIVSAISKLERTLSDYDEPIRLFREALALSPPGHVDRCMSLNNLASILVARFSRALLKDKDEDDIEEAINLVKEGSTDLISPLEYSLASTQRWVALARWIDHETLGDAYANSIRFLRRYLTIGPTVKMQYDALLRKSDLLTFPMDAANHAIKEGNLESAVEMLDAGRSLLFSEMHRFHEPLLQPALVGDTLASRFESVRFELQSISVAESRRATADGISPSKGIAYDDLLTRKRKLLEEFDHCLCLIRKKPGFEHFLQNPPFEDLKSAAKEGPVLIVNCSKFGSHVIIVFENSLPSVLALEDNFFEMANTMTKLYSDARLQTFARARMAQSRALTPGGFERRLLTTLKWLWESVVSKVVAKLEEVGLPKGSRIWWCPTSVLNILPFHGAGYMREWLIDSYISSYTPTLKALIKARARASPPHSTVDTPELPPSILVVAQTESSGLLSAGPELGVMRNLSNLGPVVELMDEEEATSGAVFERLQSHNWAHFICHGSAATNPFDSSLHLFGGDTLSLNDIIKARLPDAQFAFLSACQTAEQSPVGLHDETLHLASAMQSSGFRSVVGTMWQMEDADGPKVAKMFYNEMFKEEGHNDVEPRYARAARALWRVTKSMKDYRNAKGKGNGFPPDRWVNFVHIGA